MSKYRVAMLGGGSVGKSCITLRFMRDTFVDVYDPTIEDSFTRVLSIDDKACTIDILDTAGQDDFHVLREGWIADRDGFILVYSVTSKESLADLDDFMELIKKIKETNFDETPLVIAGNKCDCTDDMREVPTSKGEEFLAKIKHPRATFMETSAKSGHNVENVFASIVRQFRGGEPARKGLLCAIL